MDIDLKPWVIRPFELIFHAEVHYRNGSDYDRRMALISFDNSIEVSITTYLTLKPLQRNNRKYKKEDVQKWLNNYHSKLDFFSEEIKNRGLPEYKEKSEIAWYHDQRNEQYHGGSSGVPPKNVLDGIRQAALWIYSVLFDTVDIEKGLNSAISKAEIILPSIPDTYVVPSIHETDFKQGEIPAIVIATILGSWDEKKDGDQKIIERLANGF